MSAVNQRVRGQTPNLFEESCIHLLRCSRIEVATACRCSQSTRAHSKCTKSRHALFSQPTSAAQADAVSHHGPRSGTRRPMHQYLASWWLNSSPVDAQTASNTRAPRFTSRLTGDEEGVPCEGTILDDERHLHFPESVLVRVEEEKAWDGWGRADEM